MEMVFKNILKSDMISLIYAFRQDKNINKNGKIAIE